MRNGFAPVVQTGVRLARIAPWVSGQVLRWNVSGMARQFIAGKNPEDVMKMLRKRHRQAIGFTVDLLGEAVVSEKEATEYSARCFDLLEVLARDTRGWSDPLGENSELFPVVNLSVKISALYSQMNPADPSDAIEHLAPKLRPLLRRAASWVRLSISTWRAMRTKIRRWSFSKRFSWSPNFWTGLTPASWCRPICAMPKRIYGI